MTARRVRPRTRSAVAMLAAAGIALTVAQVAAPSASAAPAPRPVATGLDNPRHLTFSPDGTLYVAESGRGGSGPCFGGAEGRVCLGASGAVTAVHRGAQRRVVTGLPSLAGADGSSATGPADLSLTGNRNITIGIGLGGTTAVRDSLGSGARWLGTLVSGRLAPKPRLSVLADVAGYENSDPDGAGVDSNTSGLVRVGNAYAVTDAGGNDLVRFGKHGRSSTLAVFPERLVDAPPIPGLPPKIPMQAVPTGVAVGPDGAYYVSQLTGFPFPPGASTIWRVVPGRAPQPYATGLTNVTDLTWDHGSLYAVQLADGGLLAADGLPMGSLLKVGRGSAHSTVAGNLPAPYGVAVRGGTAYVTTCSVCAGGGSVVAIPLR
ncbi:ScyD/ScyE family protein [Luteipulveratus sp. YIM 133132]|uniref:ScyD/ScyE family protein n=1 Tax=Luteipulveratus flavus TaxID=3031728 RepID=UPI0023B0E32C|nr:ScyD/ScyE family protein [Luteipulveratus sp. YIM 133132]MDE9366080.1 ScyD/ScyE family protein [Luteipulveratus sp. YIM 133132]